MKFNDLLTKIEKNYMIGAISDEQMIQIIELANDYLNLKTVTNTASFRGKSYNGIANFEKCDLIIDGVRFFKNNE